YYAPPSNVVILPVCNYRFFCMHHNFVLLYFFFSSRRRHTRSKRDWSSDVCSSDLERQQFEEEGRKPSIRFRVPKDTTYKFDDMVKGEISFDSNNMGDWVIVKKDGVPTYNFAVA